MASKLENHWSATSYMLKVGILPTSFFIPIPILPFYHPPIVIALSVVWMATTFWLSKRGLGVAGLGLIFRRWLQGKELRPRRRKKALR
jgi:hypothetical protein